MVKEKIGLFLQLTGRLVALQNFQDRNLPAYLPEHFGNLVNIKCFLLYFLLKSLLYSIELCNARRSKMLCLDQESNPFLTALTTSSLVLIFMKYTCNSKKAEWWSQFPGLFQIHHMVKFGSYPIFLELTRAP